MPEPIKYLNTDLELKSKQDLALVVKELSEQGCVVLYHGELDELNFATFEVSIQATDPDHTVRSFVNYIDALSPDAQSEFETCSSRVVDIAFESGSEPSSLSSLLQHETITELSRLGISVAITIYPISDEP
jgi:hypothetical protein